jgi:DNA-binding response OmpR family regulator
MARKCWPRCDSAPSAPTPPVIVVTSSDAPRDKRRMADLGVNRYFKKPSDLDEYMKLGATVLEVIGARRSDAPGGTPSAH